MMRKNIMRDKRGVFGLNAVQSFFAIILGIALLAYVIVIIMGTLSGTSILQSSSANVVNESVTFDALNTAQTLSVSTTAGASCGAIASVTNATNVGKAVSIGNFTLSTNCQIINATAIFGYAGTNPWNASYTQFVSYAYTYNSVPQNNLNGILGNTSTGITSFFTSISPVYAILAILVIILVLVVLVRVVQAPNSKEGNTPQL
jgi:hypothetical protein